VPIIYNADIEIDSRLLSRPQPFTPDNRRLPPSSSLSPYAAPFTPSSSHQLQQVETIKVATKESEENATKESSGVRIDGNERVDRLMQEEQQQQQQNEQLNENEGHAQENEASEVNGGDVRNETNEGNDWGEQNETKEESDWGNQNEMKEGKAWGKQYETKDTRSGDQAWSGGDVNAEENLIEDAIPPQQAQQSTPTQQQQQPTLLQTRTKHESIAERVCFLCDKTGHQDLDCPEHPDKKRAQQQHQQQQQPERTKAETDEKDAKKGANSDSWRRSPTSPRLQATAPLQQQKLQQFPQQQQQQPVNGIIFSSTPFTHSQHGGGSSEQRCLHCAQMGHSAAICPRIKRRAKTMALTISTVVGDGGECFHCGEAGHQDDKCPRKKQEEVKVKSEARREPLPSEVSNCRDGAIELREAVCFLCGQTGHEDNLCPKRKGSPQASKQQQQQPSSSPQPNKQQRQPPLSNSPAKSPPSPDSPSNAFVCFHCNGVGHQEDACPLKRHQNRNYRSPNNNNTTTSPTPFSTSQPLRLSLRDSPQNTNRSPSQFSPKDDRTFTQQRRGRHDGHDRRGQEVTEISSDSSYDENAEDEFVPERYLFGIDSHQTANRFRVDIQSSRQRAKEVQPV
jgi:hypothetical protein